MAAILPFLLVGAALGLAVPMVNAAPSVRAEEAGKQSPVAREAGNSLANGNLLLVESTESLLRGTTPLRSGALVMSLGYYTPGDGGGGLSRVRARRASEEPNGGNLLQLPDGRILEALDWQGNVLRFGARASGDPDDCKLNTVAFQNALKAAVQAGIALRVPAGEYFCGPLSIDTADMDRVAGSVAIIGSLASYVDMGRGPFSGTVVHFRSGSPANWLTITGTAYAPNAIQLTNIAVQGPSGDSPSCSGIVITAPGAQVYFDKVAVVGFRKGDGLRLEDGSYDRGIISGCEFRWNRHNFRADTINNWTFIGTALERSGRAAIDIGSASGVLFQGCVLQYNNRYACILDRGVNITFDTCYFEGNMRDFHNDTHGSIYEPRRLVALAETGGEVTATTSHPHELENGDIVYIDQNPALKGNWVVSVLSPTQFGLVQNIDGKGPAGSGTGEGTWHQGYPVKLWARTGFLQGVEFRNCVWNGQTEGIELRGSAASAQVRYCRVTTRGQMKTSNYPGMFSLIAHGGFVYNCAAEAFATNIGGTDRVHVSDVISPPDSRR